MEGGGHIAYSELIKSFEKIRDYMRDFLVYGFRSREDFTRESARSYDDVRFIYVRPREDYLRLEKIRDVIELPIEGDLDINGWDLSKTLRLLRASNPTLFEWFSSPSSTGKAALPTVDNLVVLAAVFGVTIDDILVFQHCGAIRFSA